MPTDLCIYDAYGKFVGSLLGTLLGSFIGTLLSLTILIVLSGGNMRVKYNQISLPKFKVGHILADNLNNQYEIIDADKGIATLYKLPSDERVKSEFIWCAVNLGN